MFASIPTRKSVWLAAAVVLFTAGAGLATASEHAAERAVSLRYVGQSGEASEFATYRMNVANAPIVVEVLLSENGERLLMLNNTKDGSIQAYPLARRDLPKGQGQNAAKMQTVTYEVIWENPNTGAMFIAVKIDGDVVGYISVQPNGTFQFSNTAK